MVPRLRGAWSFIDYEGRGPLLTTRGVVHRLRGAWSIDYEGRGPLLHKCQMRLNELKNELNEPYFRGFIHFPVS